MGAASFTILETSIAGNKRWHRGRGNLSTSYAANGDTFTARNLGLDRVSQLTIQPAGGYVFNQSTATALLIIARTNRPAAQSIGQSLVLFNTGAIRNVSIAQSALGDSANTTVLPFPLVHLVSTAAQGTVELSTSFTGITTTVGLATGVASLAVYAHSSGTLMHTAGTSLTYLLAFSDGGLVPITYDTTAYYRLNYSTTPGAGLQLFTTAANTISIAVSTTLSLSLPSDFNNLDQPSAGTDMSSAVFWWDARN